MKARKQDYRLTGKMRTVIFHREGGMWYPLDLPGNDDLAAHARCNPGTMKVTDAMTGKVLWELAHGNA